MPITLAVSPSLINLSNFVAILVNNGALTVRRQCNDHFGEKINSMTFLSLQFQSHINTVTYRSRLLSSINFNLK
jgi:hypothetical protein